MSRSILSLALLASSVALGGGCAGSSAVGPVRFENRPPVWRVNDRRDVAKKPSKTSDYKIYRGVEAAVYIPVTRTLAVRDTDRMRAANVNCLGEVPDSTWFQNRIGRKPLTPEDIRLGPLNHDGLPDLSVPLTVKKSKPTGASIGFIVKDRRGVSYIIKFEEPAFPVTETATHVPVQRMLWAAGYNVPNDGIIALRREQLVASPKATIKSRAAGRRQLTGADIDEALSRAAPQSDGSYRVLYSQFLPGIPIGGFPPVGTRKGDLNDTVPHELRRELRGLEILASWLQHTDMRMFNTLDIWAEDSDDPGRHYVVHYLLDFGKSLGAFVNLGPRFDDGHAHTLDPHFFKSLVTFGLWKRPWEDAHDPGITGVGTFDVETYKPGNFAPHHLYWPFYLADEYDRLWGAQIMLKFTEAHIRAALETGQHTDPRAVDYLTRVLLGRQKKAARYWLRRVNPLVDPELSADGDRLCMSDLLVVHELDEMAPKWSRYRARSYDFAGKPLGWSQETRHDTGRVCVVDFARGQTESGYTIILVDTWRGEQRLDPVEFHLAAAPGTSRLRIIGINRR